MDKNELWELMESVGIDTHLYTKSDIRKNMIDLLGSVLLENKQLKENGNMSKDTTTNTTEIEEPLILSPTETLILKFLKESPKRFKEIKEAFNLSDGNTYNYLKSLREKGLIDRKEFSKKKVVFFAT